VPLTPEKSHPSLHRFADAIFDEALMFGGSGVRLEDLSLINLFDCLTPILSLTSYSRLGDACWLENLGEIPDMLRLGMIREHRALLS
jgi:hypothetical protein